jgi:hypothetical protein
VVRPLGSPFLGGVSPCLCTCVCAYSHPFVIRSPLCASACPYVAFLPAAALGLPSRARPGAPAPCGARVVLTAHAAVVCILFAACISYCTLRVSFLCRHSGPLHRSSHPVGPPLSVAPASVLRAALPCRAIVLHPSVAHSLVSLSSTRSSWSCAPVGAFAWALALRALVVYVCGPTQLDQCASCVVCPVAVLLVCLSSVHHFVAFHLCMCCQSLDSAGL